eukprot:2482117-Amphidinium_carterae.1
MLWASDGSSVGCMLGIATSKPFGMGCLLTALLKRQKSAIDPAMSCDCLHCCKPLTFTTEGVQDIGLQPAVLTGSRHTPTHDD